MTHLAYLFLGVVGLWGCASTTTSRRDLPELKTVESVDLSRYVGDWYEIASFPQSFQSGCAATKAHYERKENGEIKVVNSCRKGGLDGPEKVVKGRARVVDAKTNAKLKVTFFWPFWGDYWVVDLGKSYEYAVVGHPSRDYLWILSRTPTLSHDVYQGILARLREQGYELDRLQKTPQPT